MKKSIICFILFCNTLVAQDGSVDINFNSTLNLNNEVKAIKEQADGKILIGGSFNSSLLRLNNDGSTDSTFNVSNNLSDQVTCIGIQIDNKIIIGGDFIGKIKRLNSDGSFDNSFNCNVSGLPYNIKILNDGKIIICGYITNVNGTTRYGIAKLNSDGSLDSSFNLNLPVGTGIRDFGLQNNNKIILAGEQGIAVSPYINLIFRRYNTDNTIDTNFNFGGSNATSNIYDIDISNDDKIMISGSFSTFNNQQRFCLARLNQNGTLDATFNSYNFIDNGSQYSIFGVKALNDGKYIINGSFNNYNGQSSSKIAKINNDGTIDNTCNIGSGANNYIEATAIQNDGKILIGGSFTTFNNVSKNRIARLSNTILSTSVNFYENPEIIVYPNPTQDLLFLENTNSSLIISSIKLINSMGQQLKFYKSTELINNRINLKELPNDVYYIQISINDKITTKKIIKK